MIAMFDRGGDQKINPLTLFEKEFEQLWNFLAQWRNIFQAFDRDRSGKMDRNELGTALRQMGYAFSPTFINLAMVKFAGAYNPHLEFDDFIRLCCVLNSNTQQFAARDI